jgi:hypothetical protein
MKKDTYYFPHDFNARNDLKIQALLHDYKARGYGIYWVIVEMLHEASEHKMPLKPYTFIAIAQQLNDNAEVVEKVISACISKYDLFYESEGFLQSKRVNDNILRRAEISEKRSKAGKDGANAKQMLANAKQNQAKERKGKEIKEKEINIPFDEFWDLYDKKEDRKKSLAKWESLTNQERQDIMDVLPAYVESTPNPQYRKNPLTFFNNRSWEDEALKSKTGVTRIKITKAVRVTDDDNILYEDGKVLPAFSWNQLCEIKAGRLDISVFDRRAS